MAPGHANRRFSIANAFKRMQLTAGPMLDTNAECQPFLRHKHVGSGLAAGRSNLNQNGKEKLDVPHHERSEAAACIGSYQRAVENNLPNLKPTRSRYHLRIISEIISRWGNYYCTLKIIYRYGVNHLQNN